MNIDFTNQKPKKPTPHYTGSFLTLGTGVGIMLGLVFDNMQTCIYLGAGLGLIIGIILTAQAKQDEEE